MGETCTFSQSGTTVSKFCEDGCCDNECCSGSSVDTKALAIALAVILGVLLLVALIILIIYCCLKRSKRGKNKTDWRHKDVALTEMQPGNGRNRRQQNGYPGGYTGPYLKTNRLIQTGDPNPEPNDHLLRGRADRWTSNPRSNSGSPRRFWNRTIRPMDNFSQTSDDDRQIFPSKPVNRKESEVQTSFIPHTPYLTEIEHQDKGIQTPAPKSNDSRAISREKNKQYFATWTPQAPWRPSAQMKSLSKNTPAPSNPGTNNMPKEIEPFYSVHRCPPDSSMDSEHSGSHSGIQGRSNDFDTNS